jgi:hypothetical protein
VSCSQVDDSLSEHVTPSRIINDCTVGYVGIAEIIFADEKKVEEEISLINSPLFHREDIGNQKLIQDH